MHDEPDIIAAILGGEHARYRTLVDRHAAAVRSFLVQRLGDPDRAEEAAQLTFVRAYRGLACLKDRGRFVSWVLGIAAKVTLEQRRDQRARGGESISSVAGSLGQAQCEPELARAVDALPEPYREAIRLRYWAGLSCEQAALRLGVPLGTLTKRLSRAHGLLREMVAANGGQERANVGAASQGTQASGATHELRHIP